MALRSQNKTGQQVSNEQLGDELDALEKLIERTKTMYEQYFLGILKIAPAQLHRDIERKVRELTQLQIRNTSVRFRFSTLTQKFGAYNTYWKRTMRQIEQGTYTRHLARVGRRAARGGETIPDELFASMPKLMRQRILRERARIEKAEARAERTSSSGPAGTDAAPAPAEPAPAAPHAGPGRGAPRAGTQGASPPPPPPRPRATPPPLPPPRARTAPPPLPGRKTDPEK